MEKFTKIKFNEVNIKRIDDFETSFVIQPLERGFGNTLGNSLRRVLLSSIESLAPFGIKIAKISNEFTTIKNVREDVVNLILNIKDIKFKFNPGTITDKEIVIAYLKSKGNKITAKDLILPPGVEIINPELEIAECEKNGALELEIYLRVGRGFIPFNQNKEFVKYNESKIETKITTGSIIAIDSIFTPVDSVSYFIEELNSISRSIEEKLTLNIKTNGILLAKEALSQAAHILSSHLSVLRDISDVKFEEDIFMEQKKTKKQSKVMLTPIIDLELSVRSFNALKKNGITKVSELMALKREELESIKHLGKKSLEEIITKLEELGIGSGQGED